MSLDVGLESATTGLISRLSDAIIYLKKDFTIAWWNPSATKLLGLKKRHHNTLITNKITHTEFTDFLKYQGDSIQIQLNSKTAVALMLLPHEKSGYLLVAKDISESYFLNKIKQDFVANVSHELRTPLTVMHGYLETLTDLDTNNPFRAIFQQMQQQTTRMNDIVNDLLLLSRLEGKQADHNDFTNVNMPALLDRVLQSGLTLSDNQHNITLEIEADQSLFGDMTELRSAFSNLLFNAIRYTPPNGKIILRWYKKDRHLCFSVKDTGIGIPLKHIPRLTERFYRVDKGRSRDAGGTGLGLAIVKHVLIRHNAELIITSEETVGSEFICQFPTPPV